MSLHKARIRTLQALVASMTCLATHPRQTEMQQELGEVYAVRKVRMKSRRRLLEVLHSTRALDTALKAFVVAKGCLPRPKHGRPVRAPSSLGGYLTALEEHSIAGLNRLTAAERRHYQTSIVNVRNVYMHEAGAFPAIDSEVQVLVSEMHACLTAVSRL